MRPISRKRLLDAVARFHRRGRRRDPFVPGSSRIPYGGRVYDERELVSLVDASLDFWLTAGRYAREFEERLARFLGVRHCLLTNSGSSANLLAVAALGLTSCDSNDVPLVGSDPTDQASASASASAAASGYHSVANPAELNRSRYLPGSRAPSS